ncbi:MAG: tRNA (adenosine(37)-N6)-threonylcarbamoyltransferase complex dimerization subunit type 1 TsaB [Duodenibacillus sp.]
MDAFDTARVLALDTATEKVTVALALTDGVDALTSTEPNKHTENVLEMVDTLLKKHALTLSDLDAVAFGAGPGAFTGLRVACGVAQGLAWAQDVTLVAVGNLEAAARRAHRQGVRGMLVCANDARMNECYCAVFDLMQEGVSKVQGECLVKPEMLQAFCAQYGAQTLMGNALAAYPQAAVADTVARIDAVADAADVALCARVLLREGRTVPPAAAAPLYVRDRVALTIDERARGEKL